jgi:hypothetical protein
MYKFREIHINEVNVHAQERGAKKNEKLQKNC